MRQALWRFALGVVVVGVGALGLIRLGHAQRAQEPPLAPTAIVRAVAAGKPGLYPYGSPAFSTFVQDSYQETPSRGVEAFYAWLERTYQQTPQAKLPGHLAQSLHQALALRKRELAALRDPAKSKLELETAAWLHRMVKVTIPKFSLERGFEFVHTVGLGERQCLLQSILIAGLLQEMGVQAGSVMVWKNDAGKVSNLGHVSALMRLSNGRDVLVDASERVPLFTHRGLFAPVSGQYRFVEPVYADDSTITAYKVLKDAQTVPAQALAPLSNAYLRSQFYYYRGERAPGGFLSAPKTPEGLAASRHFLEQAVQIAPENPLAVYVLGLVYGRLGQPDLAKAQIEKGYQLYEQYGFIPDGPKAAMVGLK